MTLCHQINNLIEQNVDAQISVINTKLATYSAFNDKYPGFGGFIPWYEFSGDLIEPSDNTTWLPALDNGQLYWALYALKWCLKDNLDELITTFDVQNTLDNIDLQLELMEST